VHLNDLIDLKNPLSEERIDYIAIQVVNKYHNLTIADIYLIFTNAINGEYGKFYDRLTIPSIMKWFKDTKALPPQNDLLNKVKGAFSVARLAVERNKEGVKKVKK